jgi:hypothetical protein
MLSVIYRWDFWGYRAAFALLAMLPISIYIFNRNRSVTRAAVITLTGAAMFLPERAAFDFPLLPALDKYTISALCALLGAYMHAPSRLRAARLGREKIDLFLLVMALGAVATYYTNQDALVYGSSRIIKLPALTPYDAASMVLGDFMTVGLPFFLGRVFLRGSSDVRTFFLVYAAAGVIYTIFILYEVRMSPMLHRDVYGFFARPDWLQNVRDGGYRPTVFMGHGLVVGFFVCLCLVALLSLRKAGRRSLFGVRIDAVAIYLGVVLLLCKATGALLFALASAPVLLAGGVRTQMRMAAFLSLIVLSYPVTRVTDIFPAEELVELAARGSEERASSLLFRFDNEDVLALKGTERPWFGWGAHGRERVYDENTAKDLTIQDGHWIIVFGLRGSVGFVCFYALLLVPVILTAWRIRHIVDPKDRALVAGLAFIISLCTVNTLPNMFLPIVPFFLAGGLITLLYELPKQHEQAVRAAGAAAAAKDSVSSSARQPA